MFFWHSAQRAGVDRNSFDIFPDESIAK